MTETFVTSGSFVLIHHAKSLDEAETHGKAFTNRMEEAVNDGALLANALLVSFTEKSNPEQLDLFEDSKD